MSFISENVIPGNHGKVFETNATEHQQLVKIKKAIGSLKGVRSVEINEKTFPKEITVLADALVKVKEIEEAIIKTGFHSTPKSVFKL